MLEGLSLQASSVNPSYGILPVFTELMPTMIQAVLNQLHAGQDLDAETMRALMLALMSGDVATEDVQAVLAALATKGETVTELVTSVKVLREFMTPLTLSQPHLVDIVGTGGDAKNTLNVSTASAIVAASGGAVVAKHGNRSVSSKSGSADVLEALDIQIMLPPAAVLECIESINIGFCFAPQFHSAMRHVAPARKALGTRTIFNLLGPLVNPTQTPQQVIGVFDKRWCEPFAHVCRELGARHVMVVHGEDGLDELTITGHSFVTELKHGIIESYVLNPEHVGLSRAELADIQVTDANMSAQMIRSVFDGQRGAAFDIICYNAGAALYVAGCAATLEEGVTQSKQLLLSGAARKTLSQLSELSRQLYEHTG